MQSDIPEPLANFMTVSSIVRSAAESDPGIIERWVPLAIRFAAPGWVNKNTSNHASY